MAQRILVVDDSATIRKVVCAILARHGYETVAASDGHSAIDALADAQANGAEPFELVLLDFVMPKMNGFQFCRALQARDDIKLLPVVLMSAKSDKIREQFVLQTGAVDAITKPFDAQALVATVENALRRIRTGWTQSAPALVLEEGDVPGGPTSRDARKESPTSSDLIFRVARTLAPLLSSLPPDAITDRSKLIDALPRALSHEILSDLAFALRDIDSGEQVILAGKLGSIPIGAVLQLLQIESMTGVLIINNGSVAVSITMRAGLVDWVSSKGVGPEFRLGRFLIEEGLVSKEDVDSMVSKPAAKDGPSSSASPSKLLGDRLVETGRVSQQQLAEALIRQSSELIYEVLRWTNGSFAFTPKQPTGLAARAKLAMPVASIVMEGFRRVDEWRVMEAKLGSFDAVLLPDPTTIESLAEGSLARPERAVLLAVDGERSIREVIAASHLSSFDACRILFQLLEARLVRRRGS